MSDLLALLSLKEGLASLLDNNNGSQAEDPKKQ